jgi:hypothetical protein
MRRILETEEHVQVPPVMYSDPFYRISYLMKEEIGNTNGSKVRKAARSVGNRPGKNGRRRIERNI